MKKAIFLVLLSIFHLIIFAQKDSVFLKQFEKLEISNKLIIDYKNNGCKGSSGERLVISIADKGIKIIRIENFQQKIFVDGFEVNNEEKQNFKIENGECKSQIISIDKFHTILNEIEKIINSENNDAKKYAGSNSELTIQLNKIYLTRKFRGFITLKNLE